MFHHLFLPFPHFFYENICSYIAHISVLSMKDRLWNSSHSLRILYSIGQKDESNLLVSGPELRELLKWPRPLPLEDERVRLLHEVKLTFP